MPKSEIPFFVSYAHADRPLVEDLMRRLRPRLAVARDYDFQAWADGEILAGEHWEEEIAKAIDASAFGLLLISYDFLASTYIAAKERPHFVGPKARRYGMPVGLAPVDLRGNVELAGLGALQVYRDSKDRCFSELRDRSSRDAFVEGLFGQILCVVPKHLGVGVAP